MNEQAKAWAGDHGNEYNRRSPGDERSNLLMFERIFERNLPREGKPRSVLELGAGQGANLRAMRKLLPKAHFTAVELNQQACDVLAGTGSAERVIAASLLDWEPDRAFDLVFTKGVLIHINPDEVHMAYEVIHRAAARWILLAEYYNPTPVNVIYRGRDDLLWKRDFAGEMLKRYSDLELMDYGFVYHRDAAPQDDITWFLLEKRP